MKSTRLQFTEMIREIENTEGSIREGKRGRHAERNKVREREKERLLMRPVHAGA